MSHKIRHQLVYSDRERVTTGGETETEYETDNSDLLLSLGMSVSYQHIHTRAHTNTHGGHSPLEAAGCRHTVYPTTEIYIYTHTYRAMV